MGLLFGLVGIGLFLLLILGLAGIFGTLAGEMFGPLFRRGKKG